MVTKSKREEEATKRQGLMIKDSKMVVFLLEMPG